MNKDLWTFNEKGDISIDSDANDYYYSWVNLSVGNFNSFKELVEEFLDVSYYDPKKIRVKARNGAIFIVSNGDKDDTENPKEIK